MLCSQEACDALALHYRLCIFTYKLNGLRKGDEHTFYTPLRRELLYLGECFFWYQLTRVVPDKIHRAVKRLCVCVCVTLSLS